MTSSDVTDHGEQPNVVFSTSFTRNTNTITVHVSQPLPRRRLWDYQVLALGCHQHPLTNLLELSKSSCLSLKLLNFYVIGTHDIQNVSVSSYGPGEIRLTGDFISGSSAIGTLVIVYSLNNNSNIHYQFVSRSDFTMPVTTVNGLLSGHYIATVFVMEDNGLPFNRSATKPRNVSVCEGNFNCDIKVYSS